MPTIRHLFLSPEHNFFGHFGREAGTTPMVEVTELDCVAGRGVRGDRFFDYKKDYKGQITFFDFAAYESLCETFQVAHLGPEVFRRNVIIQGQNLTDWIGHEFELQGVKFLGMEEAKPCFWMNEAFAEGAEQALMGRGGLRATILTSGILTLEDRSHRNQKDSSTPRTTSC